VSSLRVLARTRSLYGADGSLDCRCSYRRGDRMNRRTFITLLGGAAVWPLAAGAQQSERARRIGVLMAQAADDPEGQVRVAAFLQGLRELVWIEGRNLRLDYRWGGGDVARIRKDAVELVALTPDVILAGGGEVMGPLQEATRTVPIVFTQTPDPVGAGYVASLARPGGNATGFTNFEYGISGKWLEALKEVVPGITRAAVLRDPTNPAGTGQWGAIQAVASPLGVELSPIDVRERGEIERGVSAFAAGSNRGLIVSTPVPPATSNAAESAAQAADGVSLVMAFLGRG
jgi:putative ABC transport system substrate-binding protein